MTTLPVRALPEKKYFKIGEVADLVGVEPHVLRYWETQFPQVRPHKARSGHRLYRRREVETLLVIRELLHVQRFTIAGARQALRQPGGAQSLLPRFFDGSARSSTDEHAATLVPASSGDTPSQLDVTDEDGEMVSLEAEGLDESDLRDALEREGAERAAVLNGSAGVVAIEVEGRERAALPRAPLAAPASPFAPSAGAPLALAARGPSPAQRRLLEEAMASARAVLGVLDREDTRARAHA